MIMRRCYYLIITGLLVLCPFLQGAMHISAVEETSDAGAEAKEPHFISYKKGTTSGAIDDYDATDEYVFFTYSEASTTVEVYNMNGEFAFALSFQPRENGCVTVRGYEGLIYISSKWHNVFVFDGANLVRQMTSEEADLEGFNSRWFDQKQRSVVLKWFSLYKLDDAGQIQFKIPVPFGIILDLYAQYSEFLFLPLFLLIFIIQQRKRRTEQVFTF